MHPRDRCGLKHPREIQKHREISKGGLPRQQEKDAVMHKGKFEAFFSSFHLLPSSFENWNISIWSFMLPVEL